MSSLTMSDTAPLGCDYGAGFNQTRRKNASSFNWLPTTNQNNVVCDQGQLINSAFSGSRRKDGKNIFSIDKCLDCVSLFLFQNACTVNVYMDSNLYMSALQRQPCLLKTNSTCVLMTWLITLLLIICPSSYKALLDNFIGPDIISPQWSNARPNFPTSNVVGGAKFGVVSRLLHLYSAFLLIEHSKRLTC